MGYPSKFGATRELTAAQYIAETMCARVAQARGQTLTPGFWRDDPWDKEYRRQIRSANELLKLYTPDAILKALGECPRAFSLTADWVRERVRACQKAMDAAVRRAADAPPVEGGDASEAPRPQAPKNKSLRGKLKGL